MNLGNIVTPNSKGQIVIPQKMRASLGLTSQTPLQAIQVGQSIVLHPITDITKGEDYNNEIFDQVLEKTAGSWAGDDWERTVLRRDKVERRAAKEGTKAW